MKASAGEEDRVVSRRQRYEFRGVRRAVRKAMARVVSGQSQEEPRAEKARLAAEKARLAAEREKRRLAKAEKAALKVRIVEERKARKRTRYQAKMTRRRAAQLPDDVENVVAELLRRPEGLPLDAYEYRISSQHGEDGLTLEIFRRAGIEHRRAVEIGCGSNGGNASVLVAGLGFEALLLDGNEELVAIARNFLSDYQVRVEQGWVTRENVTQLLAAQGFDQDLDYLGIDLDGSDYWVWEALAVRPRLVISEYNPFFGPHASVTIPYTPDFVRTARDKSGRFIHPKGYYGASLAALERLGRRKGYRLVGTAPRSENAYFLREDIDAGLAAVSAADAWRSRTKGKAAVPYHEGHYDQALREGPQFYAARGWPLVDVE